MTTKVTVHTKLGLPSAVLSFFFYSEPIVDYELLLKFCEFFVIYKTEIDLCNFVNHEKIA
jgi:hypothetical protein